MSKPAHDEDEQLTDYGRWKSENLVGWEEGSPDLNVIMASPEALCFSAWVTGRAGAIREMGDLSQRLDNIVDMTRTLYKCHSEQENNDEASTQTQ